MEQPRIQGKQGRREIIMQLVIIVTILIFLVGTYFYMLGTPPLYSNAELCFTPAGLSAGFALTLNMFWGLARHLEDLLKTARETISGDIFIFTMICVSALAVWVISAVLAKTMPAAIAEKVFWVASGTLGGAKVGRQRQKNLQNEPEKAP
jgi:flagellar basal body-associated protein FliL